MLFMGSSEVQYRYALSENGTVIDVNSLIETGRKDCTCIGCGNTVIPVLGEKRAKHFRHKVNRKCSLETYLHRIGKLLFEKTYRKCLECNIPYIIEYPIPVLCDYCKHGCCEITEEYAEYDLTNAFKEIYVEKKDGELVPDLLLKTKDNNRIYVEIAVTHNCTDKKIESKVKIIEFEIKSEEDLEIFNSNKISMLDVYLYNFEPTPFKKDIREECKKFICCFVVFPSGKCHIGNYKAYEFEKMCKKKDFYVNEVVYADKGTFAEEVEKAFHKGVKVKNCFLCRYHAVADWFQGQNYIGPIFCKTFKSRTDSSAAAGCVRYRPDPNVFGN